MKQKIRKEILNIRQRMPSWQKRAYSRHIFKRLITMDIYKNSAAIMAYIDFRNEVETMPLIEHCLSENKRVVVPVCIKENHELLLSELKDPQRELTPSTYGVPEPAPEYLRPFPKEDLDLILVPAVAYDEQGFRIGYGAGYYDRFFGGLTRKVPSIGLAFELQIIDRVPTEPTDRPVDYIITEKRLINCVKEGVR